MRYEAFAGACRALGIRAEHFRDRQTLGLALELSVDAGNGPAIARLLCQMAGDDFDLGEARRAFRVHTFEGAWNVRPWAPDEPGDLSFFSSEDDGALRRWLRALPPDLRQAILAFFESPAHRFVLLPVLGGSAVRLGVQDASIELSYFLPQCFELDSERKKAHDTGRDLLRHLKIGTLYHELLRASQDGGDVERVLAMLAGEACPRADLTADTIHDR
jgi:hypothetical protein